MRRKLFRIRAIWYCLWFSVRPWWMYEKRCHYKGMSYWRHLWMNLAQIGIWLTGRQRFGDVYFEVRINKQ